MDSKAPGGLVGRLIADRYRVLRIVAEGGMGIVYEAEQSMGEGSRKVAIKTLLPELSQDHIVVSRFIRECAVVAGLEHPNTVRVYDFGRTSDGILYIAMEFVRGRPLGDVMAEGRMPLERTLRIVQQICLALQEAHDQGVVHRDLKPDNVVLTERAGLHDFVKLLDFGIAARSSQGGKHDTKLTQQGMVLGTPPYMSPEQFTAETLDRRSDVYSLGVIVYEMLNGRLPFDGETPWQWAHHHMSTEPAAFADGIPKSIEQVVRSALAKPRADRPPTTLEFYSRLAQAAHALPIAIATNERGTSHSVVGRGVDRTEPTALPLSASRSSATEPGRIAAPYAGGTESELPAIRTNTSTRTSPAASPMVTNAEAQSSTGTVPGAPALSVGMSLVHPPAVVVVPSVTNRRRNKRRWWAYGVLAGLLLVGAVAVTLAAYWSYLEDDVIPPLPSFTSSSEPQLSVVTRESSPKFDNPSLQPRFEPSRTPVPVSRVRPTPTTTPRAAPTAVGATGGTSAIANTTPSTPTTTAPPTNPFSFPFPIAIPTGITLPSPFPQGTPTSTQSSPSTQAPTNAAGLANCTRATALAGANMNAAVDQYVACENAVGADAARPTKVTLAKIGRTRVSALVLAGQCDEARAVVAALARINAQTLAQPVVNRPPCTTP